jgi:hypothetical protein
MLENLLQKAIFGAISGAVAAVTIDVEVFKKTRKVEPDAKFGFSVVGRRALYGAVTGAFAGAIGLSGLAGTPEG